MFPKIAKSAERKRAPTAYELGRLRKAEFTARMNNLVLEVFTSVTDVAFVVVLYDLALAMHLDNSWYAVGVRACGNATEAENEYFANVFLQLAIFATIFLFIKVCFRSFTAGWQINKSRHRLLGFKAWLVAGAGCLLTLVDPWSGSVIIESQFAPIKVDADKIGLDLYRKMLRELRSDWLLFFLESLPHFIIQVVYAATASRNAHYELSPAWYVATITTSIRMLSQLQEVIYLQWNFSTLKRLALNVESHLPPQIRRRSSVGAAVQVPAQNIADIRQRDNARGYDENM